jgi:protein transport protein SEC31
LREFQFNYISLFYKKVPTSYMHAKPPTAWNDPPLVTPKIRAPSTKEPSTDNKPTFFQPSMPVAPMGSNQYYFPQPVLAQRNPPPPSANEAASAYQNQHMQQQQQQQQQYGAPQQLAFNNQPANNTPTFQPQQQIIQQQQQQQQQPPQVIEKGPIPTEHQVIKTVFDTLLTNCLNSSNQPTLKRKLDDVSKKLEVLYDKLRDSTV